MLLAYNVVFLLKSIIRVNSAGEEEEVEGQATQVDRAHSFSCECTFVIGL